MADIVETSVQPSTAEPVRNVFELLRVLDAHAQDAALAGLPRAALPAMRRCCRAGRAFVDSLVHSARIPLHGSKPGAIPRALLAWPRLRVLSLDLDLKSSSGRGGTRASPQAVVAALTAHLSSTDPALAQSLARVEQLTLRLSGSQARGAPLPVPPALAEAVCATFPGLVRLTLSLNRYSTAWAWPGPPAAEELASCRRQQQQHHQQQHHHQPHPHQQQHHHHPQARPQVPHPPSAHERLAAALAALPALQHLSLPSADALPALSPLTRLTALAVSARRGTLSAAAAAALSALPRLRRLALCGETRTLRGASRGLPLLLPRHLVPLLRNPPPALELLLFTDLQGLPRGSGLRLGGGRVVEALARGRTWLLPVARLAAAALLVGEGLAARERERERAAGRAVGGGGGGEGRGAPPGGAGAAGGGGGPGAVAVVGAFRVRDLELFALDAEPIDVAEAARWALRRLRQCGTACSVGRICGRDLLLGAGELLAEACAYLGPPSALVLDDATLAGAGWRHPGEAGAAEWEAGGGVGGRGGPPPPVALRRLALVGVDGVDVEAVAQLAAAVPSLRALAVGMSLPPQDAGLLARLAGALVRAGVGCAGGEGPGGLRGAAVGGGGGVGAEAGGSGLGGDGEERGGLVVEVCPRPAGRGRGGAGQAERQALLDRMNAWLVAAGARGVSLGWCVGEDGEVGGGSGAAHGRAGVWPELNERSRAEAASRHGEEQGEEGEDGGGWEEDGWEEGSWEEGGWGGGAEEGRGGGRVDDPVDSESGSGSEFE